MSVIDVMSKELGAVQAVVPLTLGPREGRSTALASRVSGITARTAPSSLSGGPIDLVDSWEPRRHPGTYSVAHSRDVYGPPTRIQSDVPEDLEEPYIQGHPSFRFFVPGRKESDHGIELYGPRTVSNIKEKILELASLVDKDLAQRLQPISAAEVLERLAEKDILQVFILEKKDSLLGREIITDYAPVQGIKVYRLTDFDEADVQNTAWNLWGLDPAMFDQNEAVVVVLRDAEVVGTKWTSERETADVKQFIVDLAKGLVDTTVMKEGGKALRMKMALALEKENEEAGTHSAVEEIDEDKQVFVQALKQPEKSADDKVYFVDLEKALSYLLRHEVASKKQIAGVRLAALVEFVSVVRDHLPLRAQVQNFLESLLRFLKNPHQKSIQGKEWKDLVESLGSRGFDHFLPDYESYRACRGSTPQLRGYPCGLWMIFHSITVNAALKSDAIDDEPLRPLRAIHGYIKYFFGCEFCATHYDIMVADDMESSVKVPRDSALWMWRSHNRVNERVKGHDSEDPAHPKIIYPPANLCPACYHHDSELPRSANLCPTCDGTVRRTVDGPWDEDEVMVFLSHMYGSAHVDVSGVENNIVQVVPSVYSEGARSSGVIQSFKIGVIGLPFLLVLLHVTLWG
ncbi:unnamed protein product [Cyprideis torosa]|uniref:Sulfhydryl oxidase n=1 Tax=Cyprideis torosa TaxID=163714 RepID=A0A7R8W186_9CRUS|nr:unnamed protein product [Cyprideis torosa]CAG0880581.1 unnamed protein product [Cyprideis torosa]